MMRKALQLLLLCTAVLLAVGSTSFASVSDPEDERLSAKEFRRGLKQLGLTDLLEYYLREHPPDDPVQAALIRRELRLNTYSDASLPTTERLAALADATTMLRDLIRAHPNHGDRFRWQLDLGRDLIERKAEPYYNEILYRGGTESSREKLSEITTEALKVYDNLIEQLDSAILEIDNYSVREFEKHARSGYIESIENLQPQARYFSMWARYYHCLTLPEGHPGRVRRLNEILEYLVTESRLTSIDHQTSRYQAQSLLLAGMAQRLLRSFDRAEEALSRAAFIATNLPGFAERHNLKWVVTLARLERIKNFRDSEQYAKAVRALSQYRNELPTQSGASFSLHFALALLEGTIYRTQVKSLNERDGSGRQALLLNSRKPLIELARAFPQYQNEIYRALFDLLGEVSNPAALDPFEKNVFVAGLLRRAKELHSRVQSAKSAGDGATARRLQKEKREVLSRAVEVAHALLADDSSLARELRPEAMFNLAVCHYEQGEVAEAVKRFIEVVQADPDFPKARAAADYAVRLGESIYGKAGASGRAVIRPQFIQAMQTLIDHFPATAAAKERQYSLARLLQEEGRFDSAAFEYGRVAPGHAKYAEALYHVAECNLIYLRRIQGEGRRGAITIQGNATVDSAKRFRDVLGEPGSAILKRYLADSIIISAEAQLLFPTPKPESSLSVLERFEQRFPDESDLIGRAMRLRILAHQSLGNLDEAAAIIPDYIQRDAENAGATLQGLLKTFKQEIELAHRQGNHEEGKKKARDALLVAKSLYEWSSSGASALSREGRQALELEYGEALLQAEFPAEALALFQDAVSKDASSRPDGKSRNGRAVAGLAESLFLMQRFEEALPHFNRLFRESAEDSDLWWQAFMREIECRRRLGQDPKVLYNLVEQKRVFFPAVGGARLKPKFDRLRADLRAQALK